MRRFFLIKSERDRLVRNNSHINNNAKIINIILSILYQKIVETPGFEPGSEHRST